LFILAIDLSPAEEQWIAVYTNGKEGQTTIRVPTITMIGEIGKTMKINMDEKEFWIACDYSLSRFRESIRDQVKSAAMKAR